MQEPIKVDISKVESITIENGVLVITPKQEEVKLKLPEVGYWIDTDSNLLTEVPYEWDISENRNLYPRKNHAILAGQILAPLLVKHWELTGGYWNKKPAHSVCHIDGEWLVDISQLHPLGMIGFPFESKDLAIEFIKENKDQLNELARLWQEG